MKDHSPPQGLVLRVWSLPSFPDWACPHPPSLSPSSPTGLVSCSLLPQGLLSHPTSAVWNMLPSPSLSRTLVHQIKFSCETIRHSLHHILLRMPMITGVVISVFMYAIPYEVVNSMKEADTYFNGYYATSTQQRSWPTGDSQKCLLTKGNNSLML